MPSDTGNLSAEKLDQIRQAALEAFLLYGFKRTTMEDIAGAAQMSRAALYLHFRNKKDIFRSMVEGLFDHGVGLFEAELDPARPVAEAVAAALFAKEDAIMTPLYNSPHAQEIFGVGQEAASDISDAKEERMKTILEAYFQDVVEARNITAQTPVDELADHIVVVNFELLKRGNGGQRQAELLGRTAAALLGTD